MSRVGVHSHDSVRNSLSGMAGQLTSQHEHCLFIGVRAVARPLKGGGGGLDNQICVTRFLMQTNCTTKVSGMLWNTHVH